MVVMAIVGVLLALLLPGLGRARDRARSIHCLSNVKQWGMAIGMYADDHGDRFPYEGHFLTPIDQGVNLDAWYNSVAAHSGQRPLMELYRDQRPPLPGDRSLFICPTVVRGPGPPPTLTAPFFMYGFNNRLDPNGPRRFRRAQVLEPVSTVAFTENSEKRYPSTSGEHTPARHASRANLAFVDGHAGAVSSNDYFRTPAEDANSRLEWAKAREVYWYPYPGAPP
jgi:prepilin-type processing-associated H-X9-DG protein